MQTNQTQPNKSSPTNLLPAVAEKKEAVSFLESSRVKDAVAKVLPKHLTADRLTRVAITAVMSQPKLLQTINHPVTQASLLNALMKCSQAGLEPDGRLAHLIPYWSGEHKAYQVQCIFDYKGLVVLAKRNGIDAKGILVREHDAFEYIEDDGSGHTVVHHSFNPMSDRGQIIGAYSRAVEGNKPPDYEFMSMEEILATKARSRAADNGPWVTDFGEMCKKTPLRRHSKRWELQPEIRDIINADDDTPPPFDKPAEQFARPLFAAKDAPAQIENGEAPEAPAEPEPPKEKPIAKSGKPIAKSGNPADAQPNNPVTQARKTCAEKGLNENDLLNFLVETGTISDAAESLEELAISSPEVLPMVLQNFDNVCSQIMNLKEKGQ